MVLALVVGVPVGFRIAAAVREQASTDEAAPKRGRFVQTEDARLFVQEAGPTSGRAVVLFHGTGAWSELWRDTIDPLARAGFRVFAFDVPPFGFSEKLVGPEQYATPKQARRILDALAALKLDKPALVCHSVGCRAAVEAVLEDPARFGRLVLVDAALGFADDPAHPHHEVTSAGAVARSFFAATPVRDAVLATWGTDPLSTAPLFRSFVSRKESVTPARVAVLQEPLVVRGTTGAQGDWLANLVASPDPSLLDDFTHLRALALPVLIVWGTDDTVTAPWQGEALRTLLPHARLVSIPGAGHIPYLEATDPFNAALLGFLRE